MTERPEPDDRPENASAEPSASTFEPTSAMARRVLASLEGDRVSVGFLVRQFRRRSFGGLFLLLAALALMPAASVLVGLVMLVPSFQLAIGYRAPILPRIVRRREFRVETVRRVGARAIPWLERAEGYARPRWPALTLPPYPQVMGVLCFGLALVVLLPLPFSNFPPALALLFLSVGLMQRDGVLIFAGMVLALGALVIGAVVGTLALGVVGVVLGA